MKHVIHTDDAPAAVGPYSQAIRAGQLIFTAGQVGLDPETGQLAEGGVEAEAQQALQNIQAVLEAAGSGLAHVVKATVFLQSMDDYVRVNEVYSRFFDNAPPARSAVEVAALPRGAQVEIETIALLSDSDN